MGRGAVPFYSKFFCLLPERVFDPLGLSTSLFCFYVSFLQPFSWSCDSLVVWCCEIRIRLELLHMVLKHLHY